MYIQIITIVTQYHAYVCIIGLNKTCQMTERTSNIIYIQVYISLTLCSIHILTYSYFWKESEELNIALDSIKLNPLFKGVLIK